jgi:hypothetical protein
MIGPIGLDNVWVAGRCAFDEPRAHRRSGVTGRLLRDGSGGAGSAAGTLALKDGRTAAEWTSLPCRPRLETEKWRLPGAHW